MCGSDWPRCRCGRYWGGGIANLGRFRGPWRVSMGIIGVVERGGLQDYRWRCRRMLLPRSRAYTGGGGEDVGYPGLLGPPDAQERPQIK